MPQNFGAGMIPIKYAEGAWQITTTDDTEWYDYANGKMATVMLSDGHFVSELKYNLDNQEVVPENMESTIYVSTEQLGTVYVYIPRLVYTDDEIIYLKGTSIVETADFSLPTSFTYKTKSGAQLAIQGIWVERTPQSSTALTTSKVNEMSAEENKYGLIKNELTESISADAGRVVKRIQEGYSENEQQVKDTDNLNRTMIRIFNANVSTPIIATAYVAEKKGHIEVKYSDNPIDKIVYVDENVVLSEFSNSAVMEKPDNGFHTIAIIDIEGNIKVITLQVGDGTPNLVGFKVNTTYIVMYDSNNAEISSIPIKDILKEGYKVDKENALVEGNLNFKKIAQLQNELGAKWYDYDEQKWANIVVRNNAQIAYFTWIPRYVYKLNNSAQTTQITFVNTNNEDKNGNEMDLTQWNLSSAFTWTDLDGETVQLSGYWISKYALSGSVALNLKANIVGGINKIKINNITNTSGLSGVKYDLYLYDAGENEKKITSASSSKQVEKTKVEPGDEVALIQNAVGGATYSFNKSVKTDNTAVNTLEAGDYAIRIVLKDSAGVYRGEEWFTTAVVDTALAAGLPDLTGLRVNTTYIVTYTNATNADTMNASIPISSILSDGYVVDEVTNTLVEGNVDENKVKAVLEGTGATWYDYNTQKWANIVVRNAGSESYYTWIPRYVYRLDTIDQTTEIQFVSIGDSIPSGWTLPESFTWTDLNGTKKQLNGYWISKYALTNATTLNFKVGNGDTISGGTNKIIVNNVSCSLSNITYKIYVYDHAKETTDEYFAEPETTPGTKNAFNDYDCTNNRYVRYCEMKPSDTKSVIFYGLNAGTYDVRIVAYDNRGYYRAEKWYKNIGVIDTGKFAEIPDLTGLRVNTTYIVTYTDATKDSTIDSSIPISSILSDGYEVDPVTNTLVTGTVDENKVKEVLEGTGRTWYDYNSQKWANIVVRNAGSESYYTWIPRYVYRLDTDRQATEIQFLNATDSTPSGWILPESFTWTELDGTTKQLHGYWISKYALTSATALNFKIDNSDKALGGTNKIIINNVSSSLSDVTYKIYVYDHEKGLTDEFFAEPQENPGTKRAFNDYDCTNNLYVRYCEMKPSDTKSVIFYGLNEGTYDVRIAIFDSRGYYRAEKWYKNIAVINEVDTDRADVNDVIRPGIEEAIHTGFNESCTYYVTYTSTGSEKLTPITQDPPSDWYDYSSQKWANIVVKGNGKTAYFVWVPRYIYKLDTVRQATEIKFIRVGDTVPAGWTLPDSFSFAEIDGTAQALSGYWISKYALSN